MKYLFILILVLTFSCNYFLPRKNSQLYFQKYNSYLVNEKWKVKKFNNKVLRSIIDSNSQYDYFVLVHCNKYCTPVYQQFNLGRKLCLQNSKVYFIPIVHDYFYDIRHTILDSTVYNHNNEIFVTDRKMYKKTINPNQGYRENLISKYIQLDSVDYLKSYYFEYNSKKVIFQLGFKLDSITTLDSIVTKAVKVDFKFD